MARRRMFTAELLDSDRFTDLSVEAQMLYISLCVHADDEGFLSSAKRISQPYGAEASLQALEENNFIIRFPSGVLVIVDWHLCNTIRKDRSTATIHQKERKTLQILDGRYVKTDCQPLDNQVTTNCQPLDNQVTTNCQPLDNHLATQNRIEENRKEKNISDNSRIESSCSGDLCLPDMGKPDGDGLSMTEIKEPSIVDISLFCEQEGLKNIEPSAFWNHYYLNRWHDKDGNPIKDWRSLLKSWDKTHIRPDSS